MRGIFVGLVMGAAVLAAGATAAGAADLYSDHRGGMKDGYLPPYASPSWYLRLDSGFGLHHVEMVEDGIYDLDQAHLETTWTLGGGIGRYITPNLRADLTLDYRFASEAAGTQVTPGATFIGRHPIDLSSTIVLANLYYDFGHFSYFNPYVGAGLGFAYHDVSGGAIGGGATIGDNTDWHVAGALMAGLTMPLRDSLKLDAGYRFLYMGETKAGDITDGSGNVSRGPTLEELHAHELRIGLRYEFR